MITKIEQGDTLKCLNCGAPIKISNETMSFDSFGEYVKCPNCKYVGDIQFYQLKVIPNEI